MTKKCGLYSALPDQCTYDDCDNPPDKKISDILFKLVKENNQFKCPKCGTVYSFDQKYDGLMFGREPVITTIKRVGIR